MIVTDEDALICDLAETYGIFSYRSLPLRTVATLSVGLRENSRIKMKLTGQKHPTELMLMAGMVDRLSLLLWINSEDGVKGKNRPKSVVDELMGAESDDEIVAFDTAEAFEDARLKIIGGA